MADQVYIEIKELGSEADAVFETPNYKFCHIVGGVERTGEEISLYQGTFYGHNFAIEILGADGSKFGYGCPSANKIVDDFKKLPDMEDPVNYNLGENLYELDQSDMADDMKLQLAEALLAHHQAQYDEYALNSDEMGDDDEEY